jgi:hypothetical protein
MEAIVTNKHLIEVVAKAIAPRIFYEFDGDTMERAGNWNAHSVADQRTMRRIAEDALRALAAQGEAAGQ